MKAKRVDITKHGRLFDELARAIDAPRGSGRIKLVRQRFCELTAALSQDASRGQRRTPRQVKLFEKFVGPCS